ncbi:SDR family NAD(P)-dependent oxidoreductase [Aeromicrobium sp. Root472D3]|uniref:SDR family NAD(P)-dependent oxidoreductase n=1 Tax=Aeromicrobium sp. Root472D3 TaxID=1736540 RepID=UPI0009E7D6D9|nr:glucose 1-dehydrogenase [Aeromicrobium sp. Root472D3]
MSRRAAVVTGSTSGIGEAIARRLVSDGLDVLVTGRDQTRGQEVVRALGARSMFVPFDLTEDGAADALADAAIDKFGRLDVLVNNAALDHTDDLLAVSVADVRKVFEVNSISAIAVLQQCAQRMDRGGSVVNVTSRLASIGVPSMAVYSATKGALKALTTAAAVELAPRGIRVNAVAPGMTRTPLYEAWLRDQPDPAHSEREVLEAIPMARLAMPSDVAAAVSFLAPDEAAYITGASIPVDGGYTAQ